MNSKADKQTLKWPPQLNMSDNKPHIYNEFNTVERNNAPYLNEMLSPVYIKNLGAEYIHDFKGNKYHIDNRVFYKNDTPLFVVNNQKFIKEDVTDTLVHYSAYDIDDNTEAYAIWKDDDNEFEFTYNDNTTTSLKLFEEGTVVACRIKIIDNVAVFVIYYDIDDYQYVKIIKMDNNGNVTYWNRQAEWKRQTIRKNASTNMTYTVMSVPDANPIINIAKVFNGVIGVSLISDRGKALSTLRSCWITYFIYNDELKELSDSGIKPTSTSSSVVVTNVDTASFSVGIKREGRSIDVQCLSDDNIHYYAYEEVGVKGNEIDVSAQTVMTDTGNTVTIEGVTYHIYTFASAMYTFTTTVKALKTLAENWAFDVHYDNTYVRGSSVDTTDTKIVTVNFYSDPNAASATIPTISDYINYVEITWQNESGRFTPATAISSIVNINYEYTSTVTAGWLTTTNIVIDDGSLASMWSIITSYSAANNWASQTLTNGSLIEETGNIISVDWANNAYTVSPTRYCTTTTNYNVARSNSVVFLQGFFTSTVKLNSTAATSSYTLYNNGGTAGSETTTSRFLEYNASNAADLRYYPGTTVDSSYNYFGDQMFSGDTTIGNDEDLLVFTSQGYRRTINNTKFNLCYYIDAGGTARVLGISYSDAASTEGTLLSPWTLVDDSFYISANSNSVTYKDFNNRYYRISVVEGTDLFTVIDDRYLIINTTSYWNCYDSLLERKLHYASDYNDRVMFGQSVIPTADQVMAGANAKGKQTYSRYTATGINPNYTVMPRICISSILLPVQIRSRVLVNAEKPFNCTVEESKDVLPINVYYSNIGDTTASYRYGIYPFTVYDKKIDNSQVDTVYSVSSAALTPTIFTEYINGAGNNDLVVENNVSWVLNYYDQQAFLNYNISSQSSHSYYGQTAFFVLQGQFYAFMNEKIYSVIYNNGIIASQDAIIDARGMVFVGNNPQIAFFYSPSKRMFYSFTGDAILQKIYSASKLFYTDASKTKYWYDEMTQSIYVAFPQGLLVFGQANTYLFENFKNTTNIQVSNDGVTHITDNSVTYDLVYYETEGYNPLPVELETSFYGIGSNEYTSIDRWDITLFSDSKKLSYIKTGVRSITDVTVKSEEKTYKITPDMYDEWSNSILIRYVPKLQKGQGIRLYIETPLTIQKIVPHIADMGTGTTTRRGI